MLEIRSTASRLQHWSQAIDLFESTVTHDRLLLEKKREKELAEMLTTMRLHAPLVFSPKRAASSAATTTSTDVLLAIVEIERDEASSRAEITSELIEWTSLLRRTAREHQMAAASELRNKARHDVYVISVRESQARAAIDDESSFSRNALERSFLDAYFALKDKLREEIERHRSIEVQTLFSSEQDQRGRIRNEFFDLVSESHRVYKSIVSDISIRQFRESLARTAAEELRRKQIAEEADAAARAKLEEAARLNMLQRAREHLSLMIEDEDSARSLLSKTCAEAVSKLSAQELMERRVLLQRLQVAEQRRQTFTRRCDVMSIAEAEERLKLRQREKEAWDETAIRIAVLLKAAEDARKILQRKRQDEEKEAAEKVAAAADQKQREKLLAETKAREEQLRIERLTTVGDGSSTLLAASSTSLIESSKAAPLSSSTNGSVAIPPPPSPPRATKEGAGTVLVSTAVQMSPSSPTTYAARYEKSVAYEIREELVLLQNQERTCREALVSEENWQWCDFNLARSRAIVRRADLCEAATNTSGNFPVGASDMSNDGQPVVALVPAKPRLAREKHQQPSGRRASPGVHLNCPACLRPCALRCWSCDKTICTSCAANDGKGRHQQLDDCCKVSHDQHFLPHKFLLSEPVDAFKRRESPDDHHHDHQARGNQQSRPTGGSNKSHRDRAKEVLYAEILDAGAAASRNSQIRDVRIIDESRDEDEINEDEDRNLEEHLQRVFDEGEKRRRLQQYRSAKTATTTSTMVEVTTTVTSGQARRRRGRRDEAGLIEPPSDLDDEELGVRERAADMDDEDQDNIDQDETARRRGLFFVPLFPERGDKTKRPKPVAPKHYERSSSDPAATAEAQEVARSKPNSRKPSPDARNVQRRTSSRGNSPPLPSRLPVRSTTATAQQEQARRHQSPTAAAQSAAPTPTMALSKQTHLKVVPGATAITTKRTKSNSPTADAARGTLRQREAASPPIDYPQFRGGFQQATTTAGVSSAAMSSNTQQRVFASGQHVLQSAEHIVASRHVTAATTTVTSSKVSYTRRDEQFRRSATETAVTSAGPTSLQDVHNISDEMHRRVRMSIEQRKRHHAEQHTATLQSEIARAAQQNAQAQATIRVLSVHPSRTTLVVEPSTKYVVRVNAEHPAAAAALAAGQQQQRHRTPSPNERPTWR